MEPHTGCNLSWSWDCDLRRNQELDTPTQGMPLVLFISRVSFFSLWTILGFWETELGLEFISETWEMAWPLLTCTCCWTLRWDEYVLPFSHQRYVPDTYMMYFFWRLSCTLVDVILLILKDFLLKDFRRLPHHCDIREDRYLDNLQMEKLGKDPCGLRRDHC